MSTGSKIIKDEAPLKKMVSQTISADSESQGGTRVWKSVTLDVLQFVFKFLVCKPNLWGVRRQGEDKGDTQGLWSRQGETCR